MAGDGAELVVDAVFALAGLWLLILRPVLTRVGLLGGSPDRPRWQLNNFLLQVACGASLALYGPLLFWPGPGLRTALLCVLGIVFSTCHFMMMAIVAALALGLGVGCMLWQLGACRVDVAILHPLTLTLASVVFLRLFVCRPANLDLSPEEQLAAMWRPVLWVLVPLLGGLQLVSGAMGLVEGGVVHGTQVEQLMVGMLPRTTLVSEQPCPAASGDVRPAALFLALWLVAALCSVLLQALLLLKKPKAKRDDEVSEDLVASLLTVNDNKDGGGGVEKPTLGGTDDRFRIVCAAFYAPDGADVSHLTENERRIVEICRKDEFERDRYIWGGGLI